MDSVVKYLITNKKLVTFLTIVQIAVSLICSNAVICTNNYINRQKNINSIYNDTYIIYNKEENNLYNNLSYENLENEGIILENSYNPVLAGNRTYLTYEKRTLDHLRPYLKSGQWFDEYNNSDNILCALMVSVIDYTGRTVTREINGTKYNIYIIGTLQKEIYLPREKIFNDNSAICTYKADALHDGLIFIADNRPDTIKENTLKHFLYADNIEEALLKLNNYYDYFSNSMRTDFEEIFYPDKMFFLPLAITFTIMSVLSLIATMVIITDTELDNIINMYHNTATPLNNKIISIMFFNYLLIFIVFCAILISFVLGMAGIIDFKNDITININNIIYTAVYLGVIYGVIYSVILILSKRNKKLKEK